jgi:rare lipoprotein A
MCKITDGRRGLAAALWLGLAAATVAVPASLAAEGGHTSPAAEGGRASPAAEGGQASWYGASHEGRRTASGASFSSRRLTAAHRELPFGTRLAVTNLGNGRRVVVTVNDRGPYVRGRQLDLSAAAADALGFRRQGVARVSYEPVP